MAYDVPNYLVDYASQQSPVPLGVWRAINYTQNAFYKEVVRRRDGACGGMDPYLYRRRLLRNDEKNLAVLDAAAKRRIGSDRLPRGHVPGHSACTEACGSYLRAGRRGFRRARLRTARASCRIGAQPRPCGQSAFGRNADARCDRVRFVGGAASARSPSRTAASTQSNFDDYEVLRMADVPKVETVLVPSRDFWGGVGEPPVPPLAPALCNAIFAATGKRIRSLPIKHHDLTKTVNLTR